MSASSACSSPQTRKKHTMSVAAEHMEGVNVHISSPKEMVGMMEDEHDYSSSFQFSQSSGLGGTAFLESSGVSLDYAVVSSSPATIGPLAAEDEQTDHSPNSSFSSLTRRKRQPKVDELPPLSPPLKKTGSIRRLDAITCSPALSSPSRPRRASVTRHTRSPMSRLEGGRGILRRGGLRSSARRPNSLSPMVVARRKVKFMLPDDLARVLDEKSMHIRELDKEVANSAPPRMDDDTPKQKTTIPREESLQGKLHSKKGELSELAMSKFGEASCTS
jgi:hypothetical protein